jgi:hypothetical protein
MRENMTPLPALGGVWFSLKSEMGTGAHSGLSESFAGFLLFVFLTAWMWGAFWCVACDIFLTRGAAGGWWVL